VDELAALGVPLIISSIPAYAEFFPPASAYTFRAGNATDLALAAARLFQQLLAGGPASLPTAALTYADAVQPYQRLLQQARSGGGIPPATLDTRMVEAAIARLAPQCWPGSSSGGQQCSKVWGVGAGGGQQLQLQGMQ